MISQAPWFQNVKQLGNQGKKKRRKKKKKDNRMFNCAKIWRKVETTFSLPQRADSQCLRFCTSGDFSNFARDVNVASPCHLLHSTTEVTVMGVEIVTQQERQWGYLSMGKPSTPPQGCLPPLKGTTVPPHQFPLLLEDSQMLWWRQLAEYRFQKVSKGQKLVHVNKAQFQVKLSVCHWVNSLAYAVQLLPTSLDDKDCVTVCWDMT